MQIIDGKQVASQVLEEVERDIARLREQGITPGLAVVLVGEDPASQVYVNSKVKKCAELGMNSRKIVLPSDASQEELLRIVRELNVDPAVHGILVQSPPPPHIDEAAVVLEIDPAKDVDGFHPENVAKLVLEDETGFVQGEFLTVSLLEQKGYDPLAYRFFCLQSHYRKSLVFTWENLDNAVAAYNKLLAKIAALTPGKGDVDPAALEELKARFTKAMDNDLNTSMAVTVLYDVLKARTTDATKLAALDSFDQVLGLKLTEKAASLRKTQAAAPAAGGFTVVCEDGGQDPQVEALIRARADAKKAKNFAEADRIRDELKAQGVEITDVPGGVRWKRA